MFMPRLYEKGLRLTWRNSVWIAYTQITIWMEYSTALAGVHRCIAKWYVTVFNCMLWYINGHVGSKKRNIRGEKRIHEQVDLLTKSKRSEAIRTSNHTDSAGGWKHFRVGSYIKPPRRAVLWYAVTFCPRCVVFWKFRRSIETAPETYHLNIRHYTQVDKIYVFYPLPEPLDCQRMLHSKRAYV